LNELILKEFSSPNICGQDCKYEDSFLLIEQEIDKDYSVTQDLPTDWNYVIEKSQELLENNSKDLKLASWWLYGQWKTNSWEGLEYGLNTYVNLLEIYSDGLFPKSNKGKINIFSWLEETLTNDISTYNNGKISIKNPSEVQNLYIKLDLLIKNIINNESNNFRKIINLLSPLVEEEKNYLKKVEEEKIQEEQIRNAEIEEEKPSLKKIIKKIIPSDEISEIHNDADAIKVLRTFKKNATLLNDYYRKDNIADLKALRITRLLAWLETEGLPYAEGKKTFLHPPSELELDELESLYKNESYEDAFYLAEEIIEVSPFWFDGHHYIYNILEKTKNHEEAKEVKNTLSAFIKSNEGILDYFFTDDSAFASNKTKKWIKEDITENNESDVEAKVNKKDEEALEKIYALANEDKVKEAMQLLEINFSNAVSMEEKFNWRLSHAKIAVEFDKKDIGLALLEDLQQDVDKYNLDEWNPKLASEVYTLVLTSFTNMDVEPQKLDFIYKRLCKTDISSAYEININ